MFNSDMVLSEFSALPHVENSCADPNLAYCATVVVHRNYHSTYVVAKLYTNLNATVIAQSLHPE
jgi:hypothetical protein